MLRIGIDIGGTFTDFVIYDPENRTITTFKLLSDNKNPAKTIIHGLKKIIGDQPAQIIHGSTVATNALIERKGARTALISTCGFKDILEIGRQNRPNLYDWNISLPPVLVPPNLRFEVDERVSSCGEVIKQLDVEQIEQISNYLKQNNVESVAICLLFSFLYPQHEQVITTKLRSKGYFTCASSEILPEFREYERTSTTVVNAYVSPILDHYLSTLENSLSNCKLQMMQSNGGMINIPEARQNGVRCILSGPAGGITGAQNITQTILTNKNNIFPDQKVKIITFDMGGTSTDVSLINGEPTFTTDAVIAGCPIHLSLLDIHTIGAGGGSIAYVDPGGSLRVGPQSAGADPGPACYGKGDLPTVTDANLVLGRILPDYFLGGQMQIYPERAYASLENLGKKLNLTPKQVAFGIIDVINIQMVKAIRVISVERGHDPRDFILFSFGGAGGLHSVELARSLGISKVIIPKFASTLSAFGMLTSNVIKDYVQTVMLSGIDTHKQLDHLFAPMVEKSIREIKQQGIEENDIDIKQNLDIRYVGQSYELTIPYSKDYVHVFYNSHEVMYGYSFTDKPIEIVNIRVKAIGKVPAISLSEVNNTFEVTESPVENSIQVEMSNGREEIPLFIYDQLSPGTNLKGPAIIASKDTTIFINFSDRIAIDNYQNLIIDINHPD
jgi:N-methylhydantoinase A